MVFAALMHGRRKPRSARAGQAAERPRASATDNAETLASALEELITSRVDKIQKKVAGAASFSLSGATLDGRISARCVIRLNPGADKISRGLSLTSTVVWSHGSHLLMRALEVSRFHGLSWSRPTLSMPLIQAKRTLRSAMLAWRTGLSADDRQAAADGLLEQFRLERPIETPCTVSGFWPMTDELDIRR